MNICTFTGAIGKPGSLNRRQQFEIAFRMARRNLPIRTHALVAPSEKVIANDALEKRLWDAADQSRANSGLNSQELSFYGVENTDETGRLCRMNLN